MCKKAEQESTPSRLEQNTNRVLWAGGSEAVPYRPTVRAYKSPSITTALLISAVTLVI